MRFTAIQCLLAYSPTDLLAAEATSCLQITNFIYQLTKLLQAATLHR